MSTHSEAAPKAKEPKATKVTEAHVDAATDGWVEICAIDSIPLRGSRLVRTAHGDIALFRTTDNDVFALDDRCPHAGGPLSQGIVHDRSVTCPLHNWVINLETGTAVGADNGQVRSIPLHIDGRTVSIRQSMLDDKARCPLVVVKG